MSREEEDTCMARELPIGVSDTCPFFEAFLKFLSPKLGWLAFFDLSKPGNAKPSLGELNCSSTPEICKSVKRDLVYRQKRPSV